MGVSRLTALVESTEPRKPAAEDFPGWQAHAEDAKHVRVLGPGDVQEVFAVLVDLPAVQVEADVGRENLAVAFILATPLEVAVPQQQLISDPGACADHVLPLMRPSCAARSSTR